MRRHHLAVDPHPIETRRQVLKALYDLHPFQVLTGRAIQRAVTGTDTWGRTYVASALGHLRACGLIDEPLRGRFRLSAKGREVFDRSELLQAVLDGDRGGAA